jgi:hypothetical protein
MIWVSQVPSCVINKTNMFFTTDVSIYIFFLAFINQPWF